MKASEYKHYDELPLFLNAETVAKALGVSPSRGYELMHEKGSRPCGSAAALWSPRRSSSHGWSRTREVPFEVQPLS